MKDSGVEWIGEIPENWVTTRIKYLGDIFHGISYKPSEVCDKEEGTLVLRASNVQDGRLAFYDNVYVNCEIPSSKLVKENDILICSCNGSAELVGKNAIVNDIHATFGSFMLIYRCKDAKFLYYLFNSPLFNYHKQTFSTTTINQLTSKNLGNMIVPYCPDEIERNRVFSYLDRKCSSIDSLISKQQESIEKLKAYKLSVITEVVTKGLDPDVPMKDSGVEWIGEIPKSWKLYPLKRIASSNMKVLSDKTNPNYKFRYIDIGSVVYGQGITEYKEMTFSTAPSRARRIVVSGDVIISTVRTYLKAIAYIEDDIDVIVSTGFCVYTPYKCICSKFLYYAFLFDGFIQEIEKNSDGIAYPSINERVLSSLPLAIPSLLEQRRIAAYLDRKCSFIDSLISKKQLAIKSLKEYKKSLIYEVVTGKREV